LFSLALSYQNLGFSVQSGGIGPLSGHAGGVEPLLLLRINTLPFVGPIADASPVAFLGLVVTQQPSQYLGHGFDECKYVICIKWCDK
jgi:hypothetical protein